MGPYETGRQAAEGVRHIYQRSIDTRHATLRLDNRAMLADAVDGAHVITGAYDRDILDWLSTWEPETCIVIASLLSRAFSAGEQAAYKELEHRAATPGPAELGPGRGPDNSGYVMPRYPELGSPHPAAGPDSAAAVLEDLAAFQETTP